MNEKGYLLPDHGGIAAGLPLPNEKEIRRVELPARTAPEPMNEPAHAAAQ